MRTITISILAALSILLFTSIAASLTIPSDNNKPAVSDEVKELFRSGIDRPTETSDTGSAGSGGGRGERGGDEKRPAIVSTGDLIQIKKKNYTIM